MVTLTDWLHGDDLEGRALKSRRSRLQAIGSPYSTPGSPSGSPSGSSSGSYNFSDTESDGTRENENDEDEWCSAEDTQDGMVQVEQPMRVKILGEKLKPTSSEIYNNKGDSKKERKEKKEKKEKKERREKKEKKEKKEAEGWDIVEEDEADEFELM